MATLNMHRRSPVAIPKSYLGRGLDRPETPEADNENEAAMIFFSPTKMSEMFHFTCQIQSRIM
jgi:hypothetical protein